MERTADRDLIQRLQAGDDTAVHELAERYGSRIFQLAMRYMKNREDAEEVVQDAFVTVPPLSPGSQVTLRFEPVETEAPLLRQPSHKGLIILDARHDPRTGETRVVVSVCRAQRLAVESVDPEGIYRVQVGDEPARPCSMPGDGLEGVSEST